MAELGHRSLLWTQQEVTMENKAYLRGLLGRLELVAHGKRVLMVHGSPRRINEYLFEERPEESLARLFEAEQADIILCGHTHLPYVRKVDESVLVNAGSVGKPMDGDPRAGYVLAEIDEEGVKAEIHRVEYDVEAMARAIEATELPGEFAAAIRVARG
jgi:predicted phosphodiesterase